MPLPICHTPFDVFKPNRGHQAYLTRKSINSPNVYKFNPIRSIEAMTELGKKRWVSYIWATMLFWMSHHVTPPPFIFVCLQWLWKKLFDFSSIQESSKAKIKWSLGTYNRWRSFRSEIYQRYTTKITHHNSEIKPIDQSAQDVTELQADLCDFIVEIRKENGEQYLSSSMYDLISGLSLYLEREHGFQDKLVSWAFRAVRNTLDSVMKEGVGEAWKGPHSWRTWTNFVREGDTRWR